MERQLPDRFGTSQFLTNADEIICLSFMLDLPRLYITMTYPSSVRRKFSWGGFSFSGIWWSFVFGVRCL